MDAVSVFLHLEQVLFLDPAAVQVAAFVVLQELKECPVAEMFAFVRTVPHAVHLYSFVPAALQVAGLVITHFWEEEGWLQAEAAAGTRASSISVNIARIRDFLFMCF